MTRRRPMAAELAAVMPSSASLASRRNVQVTCVSLNNNNNDNNNNNRIAKTPANDTRLPLSQGRIYCQQGPVQKITWGPSPGGRPYFSGKNWRPFLCSSLSFTQDWLRGRRPLFPACKNLPLLLWGPFLWGPLFGRTCWTCLNPPLLLNVEADSCPAYIFHSYIIINYHRHPSFYWLSLSSFIIIIIIIL